jgi:hypothetical protein
MTLRVGASVLDVDVPVGTPMSGYAARGGGALGTHDPCTVRALAVDDTYWVAADACGLDRDTCAEIDLALGGAGQGAVTATHTHSGPACTPGRLGGDAPQVRARLVEAAVAAVQSARASRQPVAVRAASARGVEVAVNRRDPGAPVDPPVDLLRFEDAAGQVSAWLVTYPCHPVVLSADNRLISGDYVASLRDELERHAPGSVAVFLPGTAGNLNNGHPAEASYTNAAQEGRTFTEADRIGRHIARAALAAAPQPVPVERSASVARRWARLGLVERDDEPAHVLAHRWERELARADPGRAALLRAWIDWASRRSAHDDMSYDAQITVARWGGVTLIGLPGEPFLSCGEGIRARLQRSGPVLVTGYTNDCPGYLPEQSAYDQGGYEIADAHRYYGMPAPFARGSAERLQDAAVDLATGP